MISTLKIANNIHKKLNHTSQKLSVKTYNRFHEYLNHTTWICEPAQRAHDQGKIHIQERENGFAVGLHIEKAPDKASIGDGDDQFLESYWMWNRLVESMTNGVLSKALQTSINSTELHPIVKVKTNSETYTWEVMSDLSLKPMHKTKGRRRELKSFFHLAKASNFEEFAQGLEQDKGKLESKWVNFFFEYQITRKQARDQDLVNRLVAPLNPLTCFVGNLK
jgi:hypothetical protein